MVDEVSLETRLNEICLQDKDKELTKWGFQIKELYRLAISFYKEKSGKAIHLCYDDNIKLVAYTQQAIHGQFSPKTAPPLGVLDVIGRDRHLAWQNLGNISKTQAMEGFINLLDRLCPSFKPFVEAIKKNKEMELQARIEEERKQKEAQEKENLVKKEQEKQEEIRIREEIHRRQLQDSLNQQTFNQFKSYAERQFPGNPEQQAVLIRQLQTEHYHQYMQQIHAQIRCNSKIMNELNNLEDCNAQVNSLIDEQITASINNNTEIIVGKESVNTEVKEQCESEEESGEFLVISPAKMWTRPDIKVFKDEVSAGQGDGVIRVGHGDTVTVRVPTHEGGSCLFWEFATDSYDIGFGVYFEWGKSPTNEVTVHISESDDEDELFDEEDANEFTEEISNSGDLECGPVQTIARTSEVARAPISIIVPVYRRECQNEVYVGSHSYPGEGVYLLKFDNSFSIWRSKTLYYRVYYER